MKRVLQIPNYMYPHVGGIEQVSRDVLRTLQDASIEQRIICFNEDAQDGSIACRRKETVHGEVDGVEVVRCGCVAKIRSQSISLRYPKELKKMIHDFRWMRSFFIIPIPMWPIGC